LKFSPDLGLWDLLGEAREFNMSQERQDIILTLKENGPLYPKELADKTGKKRENVKKLMADMHRGGDLRKLINGRYSI
jgi:DNA-binding MarR family transcriptional regulator